ncbi:hypothetical protein ANCDUO_13705, partial [Ancylostoma duodenale]
LQNNIQKYVLQSTNYVIDYDITAVELRQSNDLYLLTDSIAVLVTYNPENYQFSQYVLALNDGSEDAVLTIKRTVTLPALSSSLTIGTGLLKDGYILVTGYTGPADDRDRQVVGMMIAADPYKASSLPNKDITSMIGQFERYLLHSFPDLRIFAPGIFAEKDGLIFMLKRQLKNRFARLLCIRHVRQVCHRDKNIWVTIICSDFAQLSTWRWRFYLSALLYIIPSMIPVTAPPPTFNMYGLNMKTLKFRKVPIQPKLYSMENAFVSYPLAIDCDDTGGVITAELGSSVRINYFPSQNTPPSLCKLAEHSVYRNFPAFEKSPLLRRSVGQLNWEHF